MVHWLAKATEALRRAPPPEPQPFEVACVCTHRISGMRLPAFQVVRCNRCGNYVFVLPQDVYPKPKPKKKASTKPAVMPPEIGRGAGSPPPLSTGAAPPAAARRNPTGVRPAGPGVAASPAPAAAPAKAAAVSTGSSSEIRIEELEALTTVRSPLFTPVRLVGCGILAVVVLTGYFVWRSQQKEKAAVTLHTHIEAGEAALRMGHFEEAATEYRQAAEAVDILGRDDAESRVVRQKAKELNAIAHLSPLSLYELCEEARLAVTSGDTSWGERFDRLYRDRWIIIDGDVVSDSGPDGVTQPLIRYPFPIDGPPVILDARLKALEPGSAVAAPQHVIFAGQLVSFKEEGTKSKVWVVRLKDSTAFLWAGTDTYRALGLGTDALRSDDDTAHLLATQAEVVGVGGKP
jgi:hypothetical protein